MRLYTIGFTKKKAETFFNLLKKNNVKTILDIRLNNTSQLAAFTKYPDIEFFLKEICGINYIHDKGLAPEESTLTRYKKNIINWEQYEMEFYNTMNNRQIGKHIRDNYSNMDSICLLCSEADARQCHRSLVANIFKEEFKDLEIINL